MAVTPPQQSTRWLRDEVDKFIEEFEKEYKAQKYKTNLQSEKRMRKILKNFNKNVIKPYVDTTLKREPEPTVDGRPVPF